MRPALPGLAGVSDIGNPVLERVSAALPSARKWQCCMGAVRGHRTGRPSVALPMSISPPASEVPMTHSQERIWSIISIAAIGLGLVLALALAHS